MAKNVKVVESDENNGSGEKWWKWHFLGENHPFSCKWGKINENRTFHRQTALWAPTASKPPKKPLV